MSAFLYVLRCSGGKYYVGSTEDLKRRMKEHATGRGCAFTKAHLPFELVYTEEHPSYESAYERECQVHKWSRAKKERLIKGELPPINITVSTVPDAEPIEIERSRRRM